jgi:hypothetical protein
MKLSLKRFEFGPEATVGKLSVNGAFFCFTLEDRVREGAIKVEGTTAIPEGHYGVDLTFSPKFQKVMPLLRNVPRFEGVRIHTGNTSKDTDGCVLVGRHWGKLNSGSLVIDESRLAYEGLFKMLSEAKQKGEAIELEVSRDGV